MISKWCSAAKPGGHGGDRRSEKAGVQGSNPILKDRGNVYTLARLERNRPDLAVQVREGGSASGNTHSAEPH
jgi:hypothetical protein